MSCPQRAVLIALVRTANDQLTIDVSGSWYPSKASNFQNICDVTKYRLSRTSKDHLIFKLILRLLNKACLPLSVKISYIRLFANILYEPILDTDHRDHLGKIPKKKPMDY